MKGAAQGFCRPRARRTISRTLELGRHPGACSSCALRGGRASGTGSKPDSSDHRCAERKGCPWLERQKEVDAMGLLWSAVVHPEMSRTVTAPSSCCDGRDDCFHSSNALPMADMPETRCARRLAHGDMAVANRQAFRCCRLRGLAQTLGSSTNFFAWISRNRRLAWLVTLNATPQPS